MAARMYARVLKVHRVIPGLMGRRIGPCIYIQKLMTRGLKFSAESQKSKSETSNRGRKGRQSSEAHRLSLLRTFASIDLEELTHRGWKEKPGAAITGK